MKITITAQFVLVVALVAPALAQNPPRGPWADDDVKAQMESAGWQFRTGYRESACYALPAGRAWPDGDWRRAEVRDAAVTAGARRFAPRDDGHCYAKDARK
jgi:hypothetical protein